MRRSQCLTLSRSWIMGAIPVQPVVSIAHQSVSVFRHRAWPRKVVVADMRRKLCFLHRPWPFAEEVLRSVQGRLPKCLNWSCCPSAQPRPAPEGQREGQPLFQGQQLSLTGPKCCCPWFLPLTWMWPCSRQPSDGQGQLSAALALGTGTHH